MWTIFVQISYGIPSFCAHFLMFWLFQFSRQKQSFQSSFYSLTKFLTVFDIFYYIFLNLQIKLFNYAPLAQHFIDFGPESFFYRIIIFGFYFFNYLRSFFVLAESMNRFAFVLYIDKQTDMFDAKMSKFIWPFFVVAVLIAISQSWFYFWCTFVFIKLGDTDSYALIAMLTFFKTKGSLRSAIIGFIAAISCIILNGCASLLLFRRKQIVKKRGGLNLFLIALVDFVFHLLHAVTEISFVVFRNYPKTLYLLEYAQAIRIWVIDLDCLHRPWILFIMSENVRFAVFYVVGFAKHNQMNNVKQTIHNVAVKSITVVM
uniref:Serpentine receptor class gamma n=1 Tax=Panagrellus redivivus TaxID=6233 RepID=A0A7E4W4P2_PANRE